MLVRSYGKPRFLIVAITFPESLIGLMVFLEVLDLFSRKGDLDSMSVTGKLQRTRVHLIHLQLSRPCPRFSICSLANVGEIQVRLRM
jgi:hypothetical protein